MKCKDILKKRLVYVCTMISKQWPVKLMRLNGAELYTSARDETGDDDSCWDYKYSHLGCGFDSRYEGCDSPCRQSEV
jgi:hypothetical protein